MDYLQVNASELGSGCTFKGNFTLKCMRELGSKGALALADALSHNNTIEEVHVKGNVLGDEGVQERCRWVGLNTN